MKCMFFVTAPPQILEMKFLFSLVFEMEHSPTDIVISMDEYVKKLADIKISAEPDEQEKSAVKGKTSQKVL